MTMVLAGTTPNFTVSYDDTITVANGYQASGLAFAQAVLASCENDLATFSNLFGGIMPAPASLPVQISLVPGAGGASHPGCLSTVITCFISHNSDTVGVPLTVDAEVAEVFMATQAQGVNCGFSNGEALSRVLPTVLYPKLRWRFMNGTSWLNSTNPSRPDWVTNTNPTDQDFVSIGCGTLFYNYLAYQLNFSWRDIIAAGAPTLGQTAANLGVANAFANFAALLAEYFPLGQTASLQDDDPFPLGRPDLYMRHNLADDGTSQTGSLASSPDIIVKNNPVANPQATYSTPASINSDAESDPNVIGDQDNYLYLRVWNRGTDATLVNATVYWSPPSTLVSPNLWTLIGSSEFADVPLGNLVQVSSPGITWPAAGVPGPGHYCFVAAAGNDADPAPSPGSFNTFNDFVDYIYAHNNITWRNFNVVAMGQHRSGGRFGGFIPLPFLVTSAWDKPHTFDFETLVDLPQESRLALQVPEWLGRGLNPPHANCEDHEDTDTDPDNHRRVRVALHSQGASDLAKSSWALPSKLPVTCWCISQRNIAASRAKSPSASSIAALRSVALLGCWCLSWLECFYHDRDEPAGLSQDNRIAQNRGRGWRNGQNILPPATAFRRGPESATDGRTMEDGRLGLDNNPAERAPSVIPSPCRWLRLGGSRRGYGMVRCVRRAALGWPDRFRAKAPCCAGLPTAGSRRPRRPTRRLQ